VQGPAGLPKEKFRLFGFFIQGIRPAALKKGGANMLTVKQMLETKGKHLWSVSPKATVYEALQLMADKDIGALMVVEARKVVGVFSERDYARKVILKGRSSRDTHVSELMSSPVFAVSLEQTVEDCMALMTLKKLRHLPVIDDNVLAGVISIGDVINAFITSQKITIRDLESFIYGTEYQQIAAEHP
jgi:CBS domain-containing protein